jgi:hypothetical protein
MKKYDDEELIRITNWYLNVFLDDVLGLNGNESQDKVKHLGGKGLTKEVLNYYHQINKNEKF